LRVLVIAQVFGGAGLAAGVIVGAIFAKDVLGSTSSAGLPAALFRLSRRRAHGRPALTPPRTPRRITVG
jgi:hypothetical protein